VIDFLVDIRENARIYLQFTQLLYAKKNLYRCFKARVQVYTRKGSTVSKTRLMNPNGGGDK
jgi:hypothetical protein